MEGMAAGIRDAVNARRTCSFNPFVKDRCRLLLTLLQPMPLSLSLSRVPGPIAHTVSSAHLPLDGAEVASEKHVSSSFGKMVSLFG